jgi:hypothetical protein
MAWRIDESVIRGEIDNRTRGRVTGRIWFEGVTAPVELDLAGNAWRDLAGRKLEFVNPVAVKPPLLTSTDAGFGLRQQGVIGDCTASRRVKVPEVPACAGMRRLVTVAKCFTPVTVTSNRASTAALISGLVAPEATLNTTALCSLRSVAFSVMCGATITS